MAAAVLAAGYLSHACLWLPPEIYELGGVIGRTCSEALKNMGFSISRARLKPQLSCLLAA